MTAATALQSRDAVAVCRVSVDNPIASVTLTEQIQGVWVRRLFAVNNRAYKLMNVIAESSAEALDLAWRAKHMRIKGRYRRLEDVTDHCLAAEREKHGDDSHLRAALEFGKSGVVTTDDTGRWLIDDKPLLVEASNRRRALRLWRDYYSGWDFPSRHDVRVWEIKPQGKDGVVAWHSANCRRI